MAFDHRKSVMKEIEELRNGRRLIAICNFDRGEIPPNLGTNIQFSEDLKEPLYRVLKETIEPGQGIDLFLYTRGGSTNAVWPIASLIREYDPNFEVLIPFRAHSSGTLLALAAKKLVMGPLSELSPIDPTTGNNFNPSDELNPGVRLGISVEDVSAYFSLIKKMIDIDAESNQKCTNEEYLLMQPHLLQLTSKISPLALGNVQRVVMQIKVLARALMKHHYGEGEAIEKLIENLTTKFYSHSHMINRHEAKAVLGDDHIEFADLALSGKMDQLLRFYEDDFSLRQPFILQRFMGDDIEKEARIVGGCIESRAWGYLYETKLKVRQFAALPPNVQVQLQPGQSMPLLPGIPRRIEAEMVSRTWVRNKMPMGVST
jgi:hypothetical protein